VRDTRPHRTALAKDLVRVEVDGVLYAFEVAQVREIVNPLSLIELPRERAFVRGVSEYRDEVVAVVDLRRLFGIDSMEPTRRTKWIVLETAGRLVGVIVDSVVDVFSSEEDQQRDVPVLDQRQRERGITHAYRYNGELVFLLDAARVARPAMQLSVERLSMMPSEAP